MAVKERIRTQEPKTSARNVGAVPERPKAKKPAAVTVGVTTLLPSPPVAHAILSGSTRAPSVQPVSRPPASLGAAVTRPAITVAPPKPAVPGLTAAPAKPAAPHPVETLPAPPTAAGAPPATEETVAAPSASPEASPPPDHEAEAPKPESTAAAAPPSARPASEAGPGAESAGGGAPPEAVAVQMHMPEPPSQPSAATTKRIQGVKARAGAASAAHAALPPAATQVGQAQQAVTVPNAEATAKAQANLIDALGEQPKPSPEIEKLCERIREVIRNKRPPDQDALMEAEPETAAAEAGNQLNSSVQGDAQKVQGTYDGINAPPGAPAPAKGQDLPPQPAAAETAPVNAQAAKPDAVPASNVSLDADAAASKKQMQDAGMETPPAQLAQSGPVAEARGAQGELDQAAKDSPAKVLAEQEATLGRAESDMAALQQQALAALTTSRGDTVKGTSQRQRGMVGSEESMRARAAAEAQQIFAETQQQVTALIRPLAGEAMKEWDAAKAVLTSKFKADLAVVQKRVEERHAGVGGFFAGLWDAVVGLPDWAEQAYAAAEKNFGDGVCDRMKQISVKVNSVIATCEALIKSARQRIAKIFSDLPAGLRDWAAQEQAKFDGQLDQLNSQALAARDSFNKDLVKQASQAVQEVREEISELRKKAGGLLGRIASAVNRFLEDPAKFILEALLELVGIPPANFWALIAKIKKVIKDIADDPMKFANNLLAGLAKGFGQFFDNFGGHLLKGFFKWLLGGLGSVGVAFPPDLSLKSIITFLLQLMGITWARIRKVLAKHIGEKNVALIEKVYSMVAFLIEKGPEGIFEMIKEKLDPQSIVDQVVQLAVDFMITALIKQATVRIIALFNPAGAIFQALEAIYKVLKWIFENAAKIFTFVETVVNGIADIIAGSIGGFANAIEKALAMLIPPVIAFIADYIGLGDLPKMIAEKVKSFQEWIMGLIEKALVWLIEKGKALLAALGIGKKEDKKDGEKFDGEIGKTVTWTAERESHKLWIEEVGSGIAVRMASQEVDVGKQLDSYEAKAKDLPPEKQQDVLGKITAARGLLMEVETEASEVKQEASEAATTNEGSESEKPSDVAAKDDEVESTEQQLAAAIREIQTALGLDDPDQIKKDVAAEVQKLPNMMETPEELLQALNEIFDRHEPRGLKRIFLPRVSDGLDILAEASAAAFAEHMAGLTEDGAGGCSIMVQIDGKIILNPDEDIALTVWNAGMGGPHAEARLYANLPSIKRHLSRSSQLVEIWIRYSPCQDRCAFVLDAIENEIHETHPLVQFRWYFEDLWVAGSHTKAIAKEVVKQYRKRGIFIMSRAMAVAGEEIKSRRGG